MAMGRPGGRRLAWLAAAWLAAACAPLPPLPPLPEDGGEAAHTVHVVSNGWHTGIVLARADLPPGLLPEAADFAGSPYLEFGWGDRKYYPAPDPTFGITLAAALLPTAALMHVAGRDRPPRAPPGGAVVAIPLTAPQRDRLARAIDAGFDRPDDGRAAATGPGLYRDSLFYPARGRFHLFNTCNTWTARQLAAAGLSVSPAGVITADAVMRQLRER